MALDVMQVPAHAARAIGASRRSPWLGFAVRRFARLLISMWVLVTASFFMIHLIPGDPVRAALGKYASSELVQAQRHSLGLDDPVPVQYVHHLQALASGDFGVSIQSSLPVSQIITQRLPATAEIALLSFALIVVIAVPVGVGMAAFTQGGRHGGTQLAFTSTSVLLAVIPDFLFAVGLVYLFAVKLHWLPIAGKSDWRSYVLPVLSLTAGATAVLCRIVRVETLAVLGEDYIRTARAKRLRARAVYFRHALPNALTATLTFGGLLLTGLLAGTVLIENVFVWPGLGTIIVSSIEQNDYPVVQGLIVVYGAMVLIVNLLVDLLLALLDPRSTIRGS